MPERPLTAHPVGWQKSLMSFLGRKLSSPDSEFFRNLRTAPHHGSSLMKLFEFEGRTVIIKRDLSMVLSPKGRLVDLHLHGSDYQRTRKFLLEHQRAVEQKKLAPKYYDLHSIKVFGKRGHFIVMDYVKGEKYSELFEALQEPYKSHLKRARVEVESNFKKLIGEKKALLQFDDMIVSGNTNPEDVLKGKWKFRLPYDFM